MLNHKNDRNKNLYKIFLILVKYIPITILLIKIISTTLNYFNVFSTLPALFCGTSLSFIMLLYFIARVFNYCYLYKMPLYYITGLDLVTVFGRPYISAIGMYRLIFITFGIFMVGYIIYAYLTRNTENRDPIAEFCKKFCC